MWFQKDAFKGLDEDVDEDLEIEAIVKEYKRKGGAITGKKDVS
jgi:ABC-type glycerol-3-phosphate transport system substrate-binding protein